MNYCAADIAKIKKGHKYFFADIDSFRGFCVNCGEIKIRHKVPHACPQCGVCEIRITQNWAVSRTTLRDWKRKGILKLAEDATFVDGDDLAAAMIEARRLASKRARLRNHPKRKQHSATPYEGYHATHTQAASSVGARPVD